MWYKVKYTQDIVLENCKTLHTLDYYLVDSNNFSEAGEMVLKLNGNSGEVEEVSLMKSYKPLGNIKYNDANKVFIVKFAEDFIDENGKTKTIKYPVPFFANDNNDLQKIIDLYMKQGLDNMRVTTVSETKWKIISAL